MAVVAVMALGVPSQPEMQLLSEFAVFAEIALPEPSDATMAHDVLRCNEAQTTLQVAYPSPPTFPPSHGFPHSPTPRKSASRATAVERGPGDGVTERDWHDERACAHHRCRHTNAGGTGRRIARSPRTNLLVRPSGIQTRAASS